MDEYRRQQLIALLNQPPLEIATTDEGVLSRFDQALTHSSYAKEQQDKHLPCEDNEPMEFLGDCILDFIMGMELYAVFPQRSEELVRRFPNYRGKKEALLTDLLHQITKNESLSLIASEIPLFNSAILRGKGQGLVDSIRAGAFEAFIAALYQTQGLEKTRCVIWRVFEDRITRAEPLVSWKNELQEYLQKIIKGQDIKGFIDYPEPQRKAGLPEHPQRFIQEVKVKMPGKEWEVWGCGEGSSKPDAERAAAEDAYKKHCVPGELIRSGDVPLTSF